MVWRLWLAEVIGWCISFPSRKACCIVSRVLIICVCSVCSGSLFSLGWAYACVEDIRRAREKSVVINVMRVERWSIAVYPVHLTMRWGRRCHDGSRHDAETKHNIAMGVNSSWDGESGGRHNPGKHFSWCDRMNSSYRQYTNTNLTCRSGQSFPASTIAGPWRRG